MSEGSKSRIRYEIDDEPMSRYSVRLGSMDVRYAKKLGGGCMSHGIRLALELSKKGKGEAK